MTWKIILIGSSSFHGLSGLIRIFDNSMTQKRREICDPSKEQIAPLAQKLDLRGGRLKPRLSLPEIIEEKLIIARRSIWTS